MKRLITIAGLGICVLMAGCVSPRSFSRADATSEQVQQDYRGCDYEATKAVASQNNPLIAADNQNDLIRKCMVLKGYGVRK